MPSSISNSPEGRPHSRFLPGSRPRRIAHRGLVADGAENTLGAFERAIAAGADVLETDVRATADHLALTVHDPDLQRIAGDPRRIAELSAEEAGAIRLAGEEPLAMLEDVLGGFPEVQVNVDVKVPEAIGPTVAAIARTRSADRICLTSFHDVVARKAVATVKAATGVTPVRSPGRATIAAFLAARAVEAPDRVIARILRPFGALQVPETYQGVPIVTPANIAAAHRAGCEVHVWTVDDPEHMRHLLVSGVDGIITNRVDLLSELLSGQADGA
ncbi:glycerophosphodiester phosphodiesterase family protein [Brachybacterium sp. J153]|uniref:glycerophosphodiester phosphodiesterase family protein n=1 Tax=Brachybacterium sp. J153 TaxID=3116488 RepID=UPI002E7A3C3A|nr:glycerophosphodiester phosphodiesterase family protein [Brachybacterium sp. J153]MEE1617416.1 glycerophosphodiester phosphodiesterase family protein [Brachybacterium sp. J153]